MPATNYIQIYDLVTPIDNAVKSKLEAAELAVLTILSSAADFQKIRPRVFILPKIGTPTGHIRLIHSAAEGEETNNEYHHDQYNFSLQLEFLSNRTPESTASHRQYVAQVRREMMRFTDQHIDASLMPYHVICNCKPAGEEYAINEDSGTEQTILNYTGVIIIRDDAWFES